MAVETLNHGYESEELITQSDQDADNVYARQTSSGGSDLESISEPEDQTSQLSSEDMIRRLFSN